MLMVPKNRFLEELQSPIGSLLVCTMSKQVFVSPVGEVSLAVLVQCFLPTKNSGGNAECSVCCGALAP